MTQLAAAPRATWRLGSRAAVACVLALAPLLSACTSTDGQGRPTDTTNAQEEQMLTDPAEVLALADLTLPDDAEGATVETTDRPGYHYAYTVTFDAPSDAVAQFAQGLTGMAIDDLSIPPAGEPGALLSDTAVTTVPEGSRFWDGSFSPEAGGYGTVALLVDGPELTTVHLGVAAFPS
ncbi:hypothetical protein [Antribacter gilvus]|uniref:hypothetical protein n=1 Tax=Antribacter gilvus TaxID=2304675 RepID=UPI000F783FBD|nr:hypothetical protein [Antribacter gilvus]